MTAMKSTLVIIACFLAQGAAQDPAHCSEKHSAAEPDEVSLLQAKPHVKRHAEQAVDDPTPPGAVDKVWGQHEDSEDASMAHAVGGLLEQAGPFWTFILPHHTYSGDITKATKYKFDIQYGRLVKTVFDPSGDSPRAKGVVAKLVYKPTVPHLRTYVYAMVQEDDFCPSDIAEKLRAMAEEAGVSGTTWDVHGMAEKAHGSAINIGTEVSCGQGIFAIEYGHLIKRVQGSNGFEGSTRGVVLGLDVNPFKNGDEGHIRTDVTRMDQQIDDCSLSFVAELKSLADSAGVENNIPADVEAQRQ